MVAILEKVKWINMLQKGVWYSYIPMFYKETHFFRPLQSGPISGFVEVEGMVDPTNWYRCAINCVGADSPIVMEDLSHAEELSAMWENREGGPGYG
jgi:hypothetical protein